MFARAIVDHQSSQKAPQKPVETAVQKSLDFSGFKRKALDVIEGTNKRTALESVSTTEVRMKTETKKDNGSNLIAALSTNDAFGDTTGQIIFDGEAFDEADFDDISFDTWDTPARPPPVQTVTKSTTQWSNSIKSNSGPIQKDDDYFNDDDDMDWETTILPTPVKEVADAQIPTTLKSSPPIGPPLATMPPPITVAKSLSQDTIQEKENKFPPVEPEQEAPTVVEPLSKVLFPSSSDPLPWSSSPVQPKQPPKRTLPWLANPNRYGAPEQSTNQYRKQQSQIKSVVHAANGARAHSTMAMESPSVDWDVLGLTERDIFETKKLERLNELKRKAEEAKRGMEWIDQAPSIPAPAPRRRKKTEDGTNPQQKEQNKLVGDRKPLAKVFLSQEQLGVRKLVVEGKGSVFFTGSAGTGKSVLLREIITALKKTYERNPESVAVTASTGLAACNVGGITLHSFAGFGLGKEEVDVLVKKIKKNKKAHERWRRTKVLIIDEISMVDGALFDKLENLARILRRNERPFGGIQLVITGDFFQLPPVPDSGREARFAFEAESWTRCIPHTIKLSSVFRQKDQDFVTMLNEMRTGQLSQDSIAKFKALQRPTLFDDNIEPTELFPTRNEVDNANNARMRSLPGAIHIFRAEEGGSITNLQQRDKLLSNCMAPQVLELKKDAQVMLIKNTDENLVNGSLGKVIGFMSETTYSLCQSEGFELESALDVDSKADDPFGFKTLDDEEEDSESVRRKKRRILKLRAMAAETTQVWPLVRFTTATGLHIDRLCPREKWSFEQPDGEIQAYRKQVPLILAYAISIHKAQGQTLSRVRVDLGKVFEKGQAYVALSRATSREGLQILRFDARKVMAHPRVAGFYRSLENVSNVVQKTEDKEEKNKGWNARALEELLERDEFEETSSYAYG